jgi:hypothetical protein
LRACYTPPPYCTSHHQEGFIIKRYLLVLCVLGLGVGTVSAATRRHVDRSASPIRRVLHDEERLPAQGSDIDLKSVRDAIWDKSVVKVPLLKDDLWAGLERARVTLVPNLYVLLFAFMIYDIATMGNYSKFIQHSLFFVALPVVAIGLFLGWCVLREYMFRRINTTEALAVLNAVVWYDGKANECTRGLALLKDISERSRTKNDLVRACGAITAKVDATPDAMSRVVHLSEVRTIVVTDQDSCNLVTLLREFVASHNAS